MFIEVGDVLIPIDNIALIEESSPYKVTVHLKYGPVVYLNGTTKERVIEAIRSKYLGMFPMAPLTLHSNKE